MKAIPLMIIWGISFIAALVFVMSLNFLFWISFAVFCLSSGYVAKHQDRLFNELDEFFK